MNPEKPSREQIEARITALLLGELPADEAELLRWTISQDTELQKLHSRLLLTVGLVRETITHPTETSAEKSVPRKLSDERRQKLLAHFKTPRLVPKELFWLKRLEIRPLVATLALVAIVAVLAAMFMPTLGAAKRKAQNVSALSMAKQRSLEAQMQAEGNIPGSAPAATAPVLITPLLATPTLAPPPQTEIFLPQPASTPGFASEDRTTVSAYFKLNPENTESPAPAAPQALAAPNVALSWGGAVEAGDLFDRTENKTGNAGVINGFARGGGASSSQNSALQQRLQSTMTSMGTITTASGISGGGGGSGGGGYSNQASFSQLEGEIPTAGNDKTAVGTLVQDGKQLYEMGRFKEAEDKLNQALKVDPNNQGAYYYLSLDKQANYAREENNRTTQGQNSVVEVSKAWSPKAGVGLPVPNPNSSSAPAIPTDTTLAWNGSVADRSRTENQSENGWKGGALLGPVANGGNIAAPQNLGEEYRNSVGETSAEKTPALGDVPLVGRMFASSAPAPTVAPAPSGTPAQASTEVIYNFAEPRNMAEAAKELPQSGSDALALNGVNTYAGESVVNAGTLATASTSTSATSFDSFERSINAPLISRNSSGEPPTLETRVFKVDPNTFYNGLQNVSTINFGSANSSSSGTGVGGLSYINPNSSQSQDTSAAALSLFTAIGINLAAPGRSIAFNDKLGSLFVKATPGELDTVERVVQSLNQVQTQVNKDDARISDRPIQNSSQPVPIPQPEFLTSDNAFSTFSLNVSDVSFKLAAASLEKGQMPAASSIRSEEFINAFDYRDPEAPAGVPVAFTSERARYPFAHNRDLLRFSIKTAASGRAAGRPLNLVLLLDTSGSMERADRVEIIREAMRVLAMQLHPQDTVSVVTFARNARLWADGVSGDKAGETLERVGGITPEGGTNLEEAMRLAYETARRHYLANGMNRVVLLTDGAANLGNVDPNSLKQKVEVQRKQGIALDCFGIGWEDYNDDLLEQLSDNGDGRYAFINSPEQAGTEFAAKLAGALQVAAEDVKVQVEFNPQRVISWRQIGYAKHQLTKEQFRDNSVLAAEIAAQEAGNALYTVETKPDGTGPVATVRVRYKIPGTTDIREHEWEVPYTGNAVALEQSSPAMRLAATASAFSEWLASSPFAQEVTPDELLKDLSGVPQIYGADPRPQQLEWMIRQAKSLVEQPSQSGQSGRF